jgi:hypothetical protein
MSSVNNTSNINIIHTNSHAKTKINTNTNTKNLKYKNINTKIIKSIEGFNKFCDEIYYENNKKMASQITKQEKITNDEMCVPKFTEHDMLLKNNYSVHQLKQINTEYKLKIVGNKGQMVAKIFSFLFLSKFAVKLQKVARGNMLRNYIKFHGPAFKNKGLCTNTTDFLTMDNISDLQNEQFFSFKDADGFIYGFDLLSINNLIYTCNGLLKNPYNRLPISSQVINNLRHLLRLSRVLNFNICIELKNVDEDVSTKKSIELRALTLFQNIDALGNYSNSKWFMDLNKLQLIRMLRELLDIWMYRAPLSIETKRAICPPSGMPFPNGINFYHLNNTENIDDVRKYILEILETFVNSGIDRDNKCLGAYYVLGALTLVNVEAAASLPWLYQAFNYML